MTGVVWGPPFILGLALAAPAPAPATEPACAEAARAAGHPSTDKVRALILDWRTDAAHASARATWAQLVAAEAARVKGLVVLTTADVRAALALEADKQLLGCDAEASCMAEIADALDATLVVQGEVARAADGAALVNLALLNARAVVVVNRVSFTWRGEDALLADVVSAGAQLLLWDRSMRPPGSIRIEGVPDSARVFLDELDVSARAVTGELTDVEVGPHMLRVVASGKLPATVPVVVRSGTRTVAIPVLEDEPAGLGWLLAGGAAAVVVGVGATLGVAWALSTEQIPVTGTARPYGFQAAGGGSMSPSSPEGATPSLGGAP